MPAPTKVALLIPLYVGASADFIKVLVSLIFSLKPNPAIDPQVATDDGQPLSSARNRLLQYVKQNEEAWKPDFVFFLDSDNTVSAESLLQLIEDNCDIASALYLMRKPPHRPVILKSAPGKQVKAWQKDYDAESLSEVECVGMGCCAIKWSVASRMLSEFEYPFDYERVKDEGGKPVYLSEDVVFCDRARKLGYKIWLDSRVKSAHIGASISP